MFLIFFWEGHVIMKKRIVWSTIDIKKRIFFLLFISVFFIFIAKIAVDNRAKIIYLKPQGETVGEEQLKKDVETILKLYGLEKDASRFIDDEGDSIYDIHYKKEGGKSIFINASPTLPASKKDYTEIKTLMEIWLYIQSHEFDFNIEGVTFYFTARSQPFQVLSPTEIYMSKTEFIMLYNDCITDELPHKKKIEILTNEYVERKKYKRGSGHIQVEEKY